MEPNAFVHVADIHRLIEAARRASAFPEGPAGWHKSPVEPCAVLTASPVVAATSATRADSRRTRLTTLAAPVVSFSESRFHSCARKGATLLLSSGRIEAISIRLFCSGTVSGPRNKEQLRVPASLAAELLFSFHRNGPSGFERHRPIGAVIAVLKTSTVPRIGGVCTYA